MIIFGILLAILAAAIGTISKQLIASSTHLKKTWMFHLGAGMNICVGPVVDASAYAFAPQVIVAPFACLDVIFNALSAPYTLKWQQERLTRCHILGTALVAIGAVFTSVFADADNIVRTVYELEAQLFFRPTSIVYLAAELAAIGGVILLLKRQLLSPQVRGITLGAVSGVMMGNVFFMKGIIGIVQTTFSTGEFEAWLRPTPYILAGCAIGGAIMGHIFMRKALGEYKGVFMVTIFEGAHITSGCLSGCVVMEEMAGAPWWRYFLYWSSVLLIVAGMLAINIVAHDAQIEGPNKARAFERLDEEMGDEITGDFGPNTIVTGIAADVDDLGPVVVGRPQRNLGQDHDGDIATWGGHELDVFSAKKTWSPSRSGNISNTLEKTSAGLQKVDDDAFR